MKKYILICIAILLGSLIAKAQNVGIGTPNPTAALDVNGNVRIRGGVPAAGKVLTSDVNGNASWVMALQPNFILSDQAADANLMANSYTNISSTLFETKTPVSAMSPASTWLGSAHFMNGRTSPVVINSSGNNFIVFGGYDGNHSLSNGAIYDAIADSWTPIPDIGDGIERSLPTVVWAGDKLVVWGGYTYLSPANFAYYNSGAIYDPTTKIWTPMSTTGAPSGRIIAASAYDPGTNEVAIWGGDGVTSSLANGAKYNITTNTWTVMSTVDAPSGRSRMGFTTNNAGKFFIFGGYISSNNYSASAYFYDFASNTWTPLPSSGLSGRYAVQVSYTAGKYVVWGSASSTTNDGAIYDAGNNTWSLMSSISAPNPSICKSAISNGYLVAVGSSGCAKYDLTGNVWSIMLDEGRTLHGLAANNTCVFTWGGQATLDTGAPYIQDGRRFFWTVQPVTAHTVNTMELYLYKKN